MYAHTTTAPTCAFSGFSRLGGVDTTDLQILDLLRHHARLSYAELARQVGLSAPAVHERVAKLESNGTIRGYRAEVTPELVGLGVTALIGVAQQAGTEIDDVVAALQELPEIESCYFLAGDESFLLKARVGTMVELEQLIVRLSRTHGVARTRTTVALSTKWEGRPQPVRDPAGPA